MKLLKTLLLLLVYHLCNSQAITFQLKRVNHCDKAGRIDSSYYFLTDTRGSIFKNESGTVVLPKTGTYTIHFFPEPDTEFPAIDIKDQGFFIYTHYEPRIVLRSYGLHPRDVYETCGQAIEGFQEDFYSNGNVRIRGNFVGGKPKDSLVTFYENGGTKRRLTFLPKEIFIEEFDSLSNLVTVSHNSNKSYYLTDYNTTEYFSNGKVKRIESRNNNLITLREFYPDGRLKIIQTKKYRAEFFGNGSKNISYNWKRKRVKELKGEYRFEFKVNKTVLDTNGNKIEEVVYEDWGSLQPQPILDVSASDWINKWTKYENNKEIILARDIATEKYYKNRSD